MRYIVTCALLALALPGAARAQEEVLEPIEQGVQVAPDLLAQAHEAANRGDSAEALSRYLRVLAQQPDNVAALTGAGRAALDIGDVSAAAGFFARAEEKAPRDGAVKAGLGATMTQNGNGRAALRFFRDALALGVPVTDIQADRGLAYDLVGQPRRAQADYLAALHLQPSDDLTRRLALSQGISGDRVAALATLDPLLRKQDVPAWRARAFIYAMTGDLAGAERDALTVMQPEQADAIRPYLARLATLKPAEKAAAVNFGRFPTSNAQPQTQVAARATQPAVRAAQPAPQQTAQAAGSPFLAFDRAVTANVDSVMTGSAPGQLPSQPSSKAPSQSSSQAPAQVAFAMPTKAEAAAQARAEARERAAAKAKADAAAAAKKKREDDAAERLAAKRQPARQWVQVAGGANKADLPKAWAKLKAQWPSQLAGKSPWTMHYRFTNRLLIGPFPSDDAAQDYVTARRKEGFATFRVATPAGTEVERLGVN